MYLNRPRRVFLWRLAALALLENACAVPVRRDDGRLETGYLDFGGIRCYAARAKESAGKLPAVLVIDENPALNPHVEDVARRVALEDFAAVAPDLMSPQGAATKLSAVVDDLAARGEHGKIGCIGFGWGGGMANQLAVNSARVAAAVPFYGQVPDVLDVPRIKARLLLHYAERDPGINTSVPAYEGALKAAGVQHAIHVYPGTDHGFHDDTAGARYNKEAAELAWSRTIAFLKDALR